MGRRPPPLGRSVKATALARPLGRVRGSLKGIPKDSFKGSIGALLKGIHNKDSLKGSIGGL